MKIGDAIYYRQQITDESDSIGSGRVVSFNDDTVAIWHGHGFAFIGHEDVFDSAERAHATRPRRQPTELPK